MTVGDLIEAFQSVKDSRKPVVVHINTLKGKGYAPAEQNKEVWHYNGPFHIETGEPLYEMTEEDYSDISMNYLLDKMKKDPAVVAITSGTPTVMGFTEDKRKEAGKQFVDVGIAEETAVALAFRNCRKWRENRFMEYTVHLYRELMTRSHRISALITARQLL